LTFTGAVSRRDQRCDRVGLAGVDQRDVHPVLHHLVGQVLRRGDDVAFGGGLPRPDLPPRQVGQRRRAALAAGREIGRLPEELLLAPHAGLGAVDQELEAARVVVLGQGAEHASGGVLVGDRRDDHRHPRLFVVPLRPRVRAGGGGSPVDALGGAVVLGGDELAVLAVAGPRAAVLKVVTDPVLNRLQPQRVLPPSDRAGAELHDRPGAQVGQTEEAADADELVEDFLVAVIDRLQALHHVLLRPAQVEHGVGVVGEEFLGAVARLLVDLELRRVDQVALVHPLDQFHQ
jgi:hypothetical protein